MTLSLLSSMLAELQWTTLSTILHLTLRRERAELPKATDKQVECGLSEDSIASP